MKKRVGRPKSKLPPKRKSKSPNELPSDVSRRPSTVQSTSLPVMSDYEKKAIGAFEEYYNIKAHQLSINTKKFKMGRDEAVWEYDSNGVKIPNPDKLTYMQYIYDTDRPERDLNKWYPEPANHRYGGYHGDSCQELEDSTILGLEYKGVHYTEERLNQNKLKQPTRKTPSNTNKD